MMKILLTLFVLLFSSSVFADDISDFQIEGISIGDSLLDHVSASEIKTQINNNKYMYEYLVSENFGEVYLSDGLKTYDLMSFFVKPEDKEYIIYSLRGILKFKERDKCLKKSNEIPKEISLIIENAKKENTSFNHPVDPSGRSTIDQIIFTFESGNTIIIECYYYEESLRIKNNWSNGLSVTVDRKEVIDWLSNY